MKRPTIALVTGFTRNEELCRRSFVPLRALRRRGILDRILVAKAYVPMQVACDHITRFNLNQIE